jgi:tRNA(Ile)-lysidine synthase
VDAGVRLVRPLLGCSKAQLSQFAQTNGIVFREDASNASADFLRNRVRNQLIPLLVKNYQPALGKVILRNVEILSAEAECLEQIASDWRSGQLPSRFDELHPAVQRRVLVHELIALGVAPEFEWIERLRVSGGRLVAVSDGLLLRRDDTGRVRESKSGQIEFSPDQATIEMTRGAGRGQFGDMAWRWEIRAPASRRLPRFAAGSEWFDADRVGSSVILRHWRPGDRFQPSGLAAPAKLQDLFVNARIPRARRRRLTVATTRGGEIWWVEGLRIGERFKLCPETTRRLWWSWERPGTESSAGQSGPDSATGRR